MPSDILYLGDTSLQTAASYLAGCLHRARWSFDYIASDQPLTLDDVSEAHQLYIVSDYPSEMMSEEVQEQLIQHVWSGSNFLMIGGWESFHGLGGDWEHSQFAGILPVTMSTHDDRQNCDSPVFLRPHQDHPITANLPWTERPPLIGGYNLVKVRPDGQVLLTADRYQAQWRDGEYQLTPASSDPLLVVTQHGASRIGLLMTDLAPHWVGPLVDWGDGRVAAQAPGAGDVEVGNLYAQFVTQLVGWVGQFTA